MKYIVFVIDPCTGCPCYGDERTTKAQALEWASSYIRMGFSAGVAPYRQHMEVTR